jgi:hypothetical protein
LKLDRHHEAYEISVDISAARYEPCSVDVERYRFANADCESISQDLNSIDWTSLFSCKKVDQCVDLFYDVIWRCFDKYRNHVQAAQVHCPEIRKASGF